MSVRGIAVVMVCLGLVVSTPHVFADAKVGARYYEDGLTRFEQSDVAGAIIQLRNALQEDGEMLAARLLLARAYLRQGSLGPAEIAFDEALRLGADRSEVAIPLARIYLVSGRPQMVIDKIPADGLPEAVLAEVLIMRATAYATLGQAEASEQTFAAAREVDSRSALPLVHEVPVLLTAGRADVAQLRAARALELEPDNASAWNALASVAHAGGDLAAALNGYDKALAIEPDYVDVRVARAGLLLDTGREEDARQDLAHLHSRGLDDPRASYLRALLAMRSGDRAAANVLLEQVTHFIDAVKPDWLLGREQLLMLGALSHQALGQGRKARPYLEILSERYPRNLGARRMLASFLIDEGELLQARPLIEDILRGDPQDVESLLLMGRIFLAQKRNPQALAYFDRALAAGSDEDVRTQTTAGYGQLFAGEGGRAMASLERAFAAGAVDPALVTTLATLYLRHGETAKAVAVAQSLADREPDSAFAHNLLGVVHAAGGGLEAAHVAYAQALQLDPTLQAARLNLARIDAALGNVAAARAALETLIARDRRDADAMYELGLLEFDAGRRADGITWLEKAFDERPPTPRTGLTLVDAHLANGDAAKALEVARTLVGRHSSTLDTLSALARVQLASNDQGAARQSLREMSRLAELDSPWQIRIGYMQLDAGLFAEAAYSAHKILSVREKDPMALVLSAKAALAQGNVDRAHDFVAVLQELYPDRADTLRLAGHADGTVHNNLANVLSTLGDMPGALEHARRAIEVAPENPSVADTVGWFSDAGTGTDRRVIADAYFPRWDGGLGVASRYEGANVSAPDDALDNSSRVDVILLSFPRQIALDSLRLGWVQNDSDVAVLAWMGAADGPAMGLGASRTLSEMAPTGEGWNSVANLSKLGQNTNLGTFSTTTTSVYSKFWLIGAGAFAPGSGFANGDGKTDYVKLATIGGRFPPSSNAVPEPGSLALLTLAGVGLAGMRRLRQCRAPCATSGSAAFAATPGL